MVFILTILPSISYAACKKLTGNIVFMDFDNSKEEMKAARQSAESNCQNFTVVNNEVDAKKLFKSFNSKKIPIDDLILSGHSGSMGFSGTNFKLNHDELVSLIDKNPFVKSHLNNLFLWGCYTNNIAKLDVWLKNIPHLDYVFGFKKKSPLDSQLLGAEFLGKALAYKNQLKEKKSLEEIKSFLDETVVPGNSQYHYVFPAIYGHLRCENSKAKEFYYVIDQIEDGTKSEINNFSEFKKECSSKIETYNKEFKDQLTKYWNGYKEMPGINDVDSKNPEVNPIRMTAYPWANDNEHCFSGEGFDIGEGNFLSIGQILNLIFTKTIQKNYFAFFKDDATKLTAILEKLGNHKELIGMLQKEPNLRRREVQNLSHDLSQLANNKTVTDQLKKDEVKDFTNIAYRIKKYLLDMDDRCVDIEWIDEKSDFKKPPSFCLQP
jgi:hypothetical protein